MNYIAYILRNPKKLNFRRIKRGLVYKFAHFYSDRKFLETLFPLRVGYKLNLDNPQTFNEKLQWLKLYDRRPEYTHMVDKMEAKKYVASIIGEEYIIPTLEVYDRAEDIDFDALPNQFVLKCTHDSGGIVICRDKSKLDRKAVRKKLAKGLKVNYFYQNREWPYKNVRPRIIAEQYMSDNGGRVIDDKVHSFNGITETYGASDELSDYKWFCFNGKAEFFKIDFGRFVDHHANYYDTNMNMLPFGEADFLPIPDAPIRIPDTISKMLAMAEKLSSGIPFLRVDFYEVDGRIYFGELTFYPASGMGQFAPPQYDTILGRKIELPQTFVHA